MILCGNPAVHDAQLAKTFLCVITNIDIDIAYFVHRA